MVKYAKFGAGGERRCVIVCRGDPSPIAIGASLVPPQDDIAKVEDDPEGGRRAVVILRKLRMTG